MRKLAHTMLRVTNMEHSIHFYTQTLGMRVLRKVEQPEENYSLTFIGYESESNASVLELTYNYGISAYEHGNAFGHIAIFVDNVYTACSEIASLGGNITRPPGPLKGSSELIAFITDPDGYKIELIQKPDSLPGAST